MVKELLLVRPSACEPRSPHHPDARDVAERIGAYLVATDRQPDGIVATPDRRSRKLAEGAAKAMGFSAAAVGYTPRSRRDGAPWFVTQQGFEDERLLAVQEVPDLDLPRAPLLTIDRTSTRNPRVRKVVGRNGLPRSFPFPTPTGTEMRPRPAYYYVQAGVIPYRATGAGPEILLVTNQKGTRWMVPKGVHEPGFTAQASAAKEAFEEAGVLGDVEGETAGSYRVKKWGGICTVTLFPLLATRVLAEAEWMESHRRRCWVPAARAGLRIAKPGLARLVARFADTLA